MRHNKEVTDTGNGICLEKEELAGAGGEIKTSWGRGLECNIYMHEIAHNKFYFIEATITKNC